MVDKELISEISFVGLPVKQEEPSGRRHRARNKREPHFWSVIFSILKGNCWQSEGHSR
jgi:hypothetical protein